MLTVYKKRLIRPGSLGKGRGNKERSSTHFQVHKSISSTFSLNLISNAICLPDLSLSWSFPVLVSIVARHFASWGDNGVGYFRIK